MSTAGTRRFANLDRLSGGRALHGIGSGWGRQESEAMGVDFDGAAGWRRRVFERASLALGRLTPAVALTSC